MNISRRTALLGTTGALLGGLPSIAHSTPSCPISPMFHITSNPEPVLLRVPAPGWLRFSDGIPYPTWVGRSVSSVYEAEDILLNAVQPHTYQLPNSWYVEWHKNPIFLYCGDGQISPSLIVNRYCNVISANSRRGPGNLAFMHPTTFKQLIDCSFTSAFAPLDRMLVGRWTKQGILNNSVIVYTSDHMPDMEIGLMYSGAIDMATGLAVYDSGAVLVDRGKDGLLLIDDVQQPEMTTSSAAAYMARLRFIEATD